MFGKSPASEFPHDNPDLSLGVAWICQSVCAPPLACSTGQLVWPGPSTLRACRPVLVESAKAKNDSESAGAVELRSELPRTDAADNSPFARFVWAMTHAALTAGATQAAGDLGVILGEGRLRPFALSASAKEALIARGFATRDGSSASPGFCETALAWRKVLEGSAGDLSACGERTLDEWGSALLSALLGWSESRAPELRRLLRQHGVAAFGMREAA